MYNDWFSIGPVSIHGYGVCIAVGLLAALFLATRRGRKRGMDEDVIYGIVLSATFFGFLGAKIMYCIVEWKTFIQDPISIFSSSGFVVYGGLTGGVLAIFIYTKIKKVDQIKYLEVCIPSVSVGQAFGRLGCFFAGCCYGKETDSIIGITFHNSLYAPNDVKLMPTQLISSAGNLLIAIILILVAAKVSKKGIILGLYLTLYSIGRFLVEMLRNDNRGSVGRLSTSQFYGIFVLIIGVCILIFAATRKEKPATEEAESEKNEEI